MSPAFVLAVAVTLAPAADPKKVDINVSGRFEAGLTLAECDGPVFAVSLAGRMDKAGGTVTLTLDPTPPAFDPFGQPIHVKPRPPVKLDGTLTLDANETVTVRAFVPFPHDTEVERRRYALAGPKVRSKLSLAHEAGDRWGGEYYTGRLLVHGADGAVKQVVPVNSPPPLPPCHPGCFPSGTPVRVPGGTTPIERLRPGDVVLTVDADGKPGEGRIASIFETENRPLTLETDAGTLVTTTTQPLALAGGGLKAAGELKAGDRVMRWDAGGRRAAAVRAVSAPADRAVRVFNLVLGGPVCFVADGFVARSKPPAPAGAAIGPAIP